jgi:hypothetical protein
MNTYNKEYMLVQTFIDLDTQISDIARRLSKNRFIEIGDDPNLVRDIESALFRIYGKVKLIEPYFDLNITPLSKANVYFALIKHVNDTLKYLQEVRKKDFGSRQHTHELLERLESCTKSLYAIGDIVSVNTELVH